MLLRESETLGDILLITSIADIEELSPKQWFPIHPGENSQGTLLVVAGPDVLYAGDI
jgi:hypothetical protein